MVVWIFILNVYLFEGLRLAKVHRDIFGQLFVWCSVSFFILCVGAKRKETNPKKKKNQRLNGCLGYLKDNKC
jgi:hypothetical protein